MEWVFPLDIPYIPLLCDLLPRRREHDGLRRILHMVGCSLIVRTQHSINKPFLTVIMETQTWKREVFTGPDP